MKRYLQLLIVIISTATFAQEIPDYSSTPRKDIPVEYTWKLDDIYKDSAAWAKDKAEVEKMINQIDAKAKNWTKSAKSMLDVFELQSNIGKLSGKLYSYASHSSNSDLGDGKYQIMKGEVTDLFVKAGSKFSFMQPDILTVNEKTIEGYLKQEPKLKPYEFYLKEVLRSKKHLLPKEQEALLAMTGLFSDTPDEAFNALNDVDMPKVEVTLSDGRKVELTYSNFQIIRGSNNPADRALVMRAYWDNHKKYENTFAALFNGEMKKHLFNAQVRKFNNTLEAKLFSDDIDTNVYINLISNVKANLEPLHRYLTLKKQLLGLDVIKYDDIYASSVKEVEKKYAYKEAQEIIIKAMEPMGEEYLAPLRTAFQNRWVDIYPNKNKQTGAYSSGVYGVHPFIKMNYNGEYDAMSTLIHELGHSMHSHFSYSTQPYATAFYPIFTAEIASTFNEHLLLDYLLKNEKDDLFKLYLLDNYFEQLRGTIYRQTLFADFELAMHRRVEEGKTLTADWLSDKYLELTRLYYGHDKGVMQVDEYISNEWSNIPHFFMNYYVFQYSTGIIASMDLSERVLKGDKKEVDNYLNLLKAGGKNHPMVLLKEAGVDMASAKPYENAFARMNYLVGEMEKLVAKLKNK